MSRYNTIPQDILDTIIGETYDGTYTVKDEIDNVLKEDVIAFNVVNYPDGTFAGIEIWTQTWASVLVYTMFGDKALVKIKRNP